MLSSLNIGVPALKKRFDLLWEKLVDLKWLPKRVLDISGLFSYSAGLGLWFWASMVLVRSVGLVLSDMLKEGARLVLTINSDSSLYLPIPGILVLLESI